MSSRRSPATASSSCPAASRSASRRSRRRRHASRRTRSRRDRGGPEARRAAAAGARGARDQGPADRGRRAVRAVRTGPVRRPGGPRAAVPGHRLGDRRRRRLDPAWIAYDAAQVWTMTSIGSLCADREAAHQAVTLGKGWDWVFNGGTAQYRAPPILEPEPAAGHRPAPRSSGRSTPATRASSRQHPAASRRGDRRPRVPDPADEPAGRRTPGGGALSFAVPEAVVPRVAGHARPRRRVSRGEPHERPRRRWHPLDAPASSTSTGSRGRASA